MTLLVRVALEHLHLRDHNTLFFCAAAALTIENMPTIDPNAKYHSIWAVIDSDYQKLTKIYVLLRE